jgi:hypothetical protein
MTMKLRITLLLIFSLLSCTGLRAQYPPAVGQAGTTAMYKDSSAFIGWATQCSVVRGYQDISNLGGGLASTGDSLMATGPAGTNGVVSLGDGGYATLTFAWPLTNGPGWDFAVFENSFDDYFLELAFVEVSSDGMNFFRFPAHSLTDTMVQVAGFDSLDARLIDNLAGKYRGMYGTPFDLQDLEGTAGLDLNRITHIRVRDVVGCIQKQYASYDSAGNKINDPWPTPFASGGFDLDGVGVIWDQTNSVNREEAMESLKVWPNPAQGSFSISLPPDESFEKVDLISLCGEVILSKNIESRQSSLLIQATDLPSGIYLLKLSGSQGSSYGKLILNKN